MFLNITNAPAIRANSTVQQKSLNTMRRLRDGAPSLGTTKIVLHKLLIRMSLPYAKDAESRTRVSVFIRPTPIIIIRPYHGTTPIWGRPIGPKGYLHCLRTLRIEKTVQNG